ncbi:IS4 family transposase, partial [Mycobacterium riyadhense]|nr:IS4 family transposase [Mycobacterium riyadhense]
ANDEYFSRPGAGGRGEKAAFPQARILGLAECATHAVFAATLTGSPAGSPDSYPR